MRCNEKLTNKYLLPCDSKLFELLLLPVLGAYKPLEIIQARS